MPVSIGSTVTDPDPAVIASNWPAPPGRVSVTVSTGVQTPPGVGVGLGVGVGVGVGLGVGVGVGVGVGAGPPVHCARISTPAKRLVALNVKSTACPGFGTVNVAVTGLNVPGVNAGIVTVAFVALTSE